MSKNENRKKILENSSKHAEEVFKRPQVLIYKAKEDWLTLNIDSLNMTTKDPLSALAST